MKTREVMTKFPLQMTFRNGTLPPAAELWIRLEAAKLENFYCRIMGCRVEVGKSAPPLPPGPSVRDETQLIQHHSRDHNGLELFFDLFFALARGLAPALAGPLLFDGIAALRCCPGFRFACFFSAPFFGFSRSYTGLSNRCGVTGF